MIMEEGFAYARRMGHDYIQCPKCKVLHLLRGVMFSGQVIKCHCGTTFIEHLKHNKVPAVT